MQKFFKRVIMQQVGEYSVFWIYIVIRFERDPLFSIIHIYTYGVYYTHIYVILFAKYNEKCVIYI